MQFKINDVSHVASFQSGGLPLPAAAADLAFEQFHPDGLARLDAVLLSPTPNYGVHAASQSD